MKGIGRAERRIISLALGAFIGTAVWGMDPVSAEEALKMRMEADEFLASRPDGLQDRQTLSVRRAIAGDLSGLQAVRRSRDNVQTLSGNVIAEDVRIPGPDGAVGIRIYRNSSPVSEKLPVLVYFHGGGWTFGSLNSCAAVCDALARSGKVVVVGVNYRLAPEYPYPAPLTDCVAAFRYVCDHASEWGGDPARVSVGGDSSGGNLALGVALQEAMKGDAGMNPASVVAVYPVLKAFAVPEDGSWSRYAKSYALDACQMEAFDAAYTAGNDSIARLPLVSPAMASDTLLEQLPPVLIINAERDILLDQGLEFASRLQQLGVRSRHELLPGAVHLLVTLPGQHVAFERMAGLMLEFMEFSSSDTGREKQPCKKNGI